MNLRTLASLLIAFSLLFWSRSASGDPPPADKALTGLRITEESVSTAFAQQRIIGELIRSMDFSRLRLTLADTGRETRQQQDKIVEILATLIRQAEERESSSRSSAAAAQSQGPGTPGETQAQAQGEDGQTGSSGGGSKGTDDDPANRLERGGPRSPWSQLRDKERDPVYNAIKQRFPARYQQLLEQYYKSFHDEDKARD